MVGGVCSQILLPVLFQGFDRSSQAFVKLLEIRCRDHNRLWWTLALRDIYCMSSHSGIIL